MKEKLLALWGKVVENKDVVIQIGGVVAGAVVGALVTAVIIRAQDESLLLEEEIIMGIEDEED